MRLCCAVLCGFTLHPGAAFASSQCVGSWEQGALRQGVQLPSQGANFSAYSDLGVMLGRNYVHDKVAIVLLNTYQQVAKQAPELRFVYGETGFAEGGAVQAPQNTSKWFVGGFLRAGAHAYRRDHHAVYFTAE